MLRVARGNKALARTLAILAVLAMAGYPVRGYGDDRYEGAEIEGTVIQVNTTANTFTARVLESDDLGGLGLTNPVTVDCSAVEYAENWLSPGDYVEAEGRYYPASNVLSTYEVELDHRDGDDDGDEHLDGDDDRNDDDDD